MPAGVAALRALRRALTTCRSALRLPPPGPVRQRPSLLRRRYRHRPQPEARRSAIKASRLLIADRRPAWRDDDQRLHAARHARARARRFVHVHTEPEELGRVYQADLAIHVGPRRLRRGALAALAADAAPALGRRDRARRMPTTSPGRAPTAIPGALQHGRDRDAGCATGCPADAIITNGAGNYAIWVQPLTSPTARFGTPARARPPARWATACRRRSRPSCVHPERTVDLLRRRRLLPDDRPGAGDGRAVRPARSSSSSSTTACTARSACTRSASIRAASPAPT